ncbi:DUF2516 family protein [Lentzea sp. NPDC034063]|uniref:DUF2516 family protein n=1 Tax=Lentzea sokolovensis TaxID=3095429 RepID=A0ABU4UZL8_9PSEU|nr:MULTISPECIES: DUF2516 family protein [Lentzea]MDX8144557.1 DUF2516 family protein [Lentzea sp. BCCO 10_0061]WUD29847.1 DUF2516 family protein [Lentzea sp. NBC_00516]
MWNLDGIVYFFADLGFSIFGLFAFFHALSQRPDAYTAIERMTKPAWMGITGGGTAALLLFGPGGVGSIFWLAGLIAVLVYMVDVRPKLIEVQRGPRW